MEEKNIFALRLFFQIKKKNSIKSRVIIFKMPFLGFKLSNSRELPAVETLSSYLIKKLMKLDYEDFEMDRIRVILYSYSESVNRESKDPFSPYLRPGHSLQLITRIISSLKSEDRKKEFSMILGSLSGDIIFRNISQDKEVGVQYCEMILNWYTVNWNNDWYIPKFFGSVVHEYPEFKSKIDKKWGVGIE